MPDARRVTAVIAAAGKGSRLGAELPKAFVTLRDRSLVVRSVQAMIHSAIVDQVIVVISPEMEPLALQQLGDAGLLEAEIPVRLVHGGAERFDSVWAGLQAIDASDGVVLVHDSARALTPPGMIARVVRAVLDGSPAVVPVLPVSDTIKQVHEPATGVTAVAGTPDRSSLRSVQTPQGFDLRLLRRANEAYFGGVGKQGTAGSVGKQSEAGEAGQSGEASQAGQASAAGFQPTDDASLVEWLGHRVTCVAGDPMAFKVTTPIDFLLARAVTDEAEPTVFEVPRA